VPPRRFHNLREPAGSGISYDGGYSEFVLAPKERWPAFQAN